MARWTALTLAAVVSAAAIGRAAAADAKELLGTWTPADGSNQVTLTVEPDTLRCRIEFDEGFTLSLAADYTVSADGVLLGIVRPRAGAQVELEDRLFHFRFRLEKDELVVSEVGCRARVRERVRQLVLGAYRKADSPPAARADKPGLSGERAQGCSSDASRRIQELLNISEDLRLIEEEWRRMWIDRQPGHLTPERVHGGIQDGEAPPLPRPPDESQPPAAEPGAGACCTKGEDYAPVFPPPADRPRFSSEVTPPSKAEVEEALRRLLRERGLGPSDGVDIEVAQVHAELLVDRVETAHLHHQTGLTRLHHRHWRCTVLYLEASGPVWGIWSSGGESLTWRANGREPRAEVVYVSKDELHPCVRGEANPFKIETDAHACPTDAERPRRGMGIIFCPARGVLNRNRPGATGSPAPPPGSP